MFNMKKFAMAGTVVTSSLFLVAAASAQDAGSATNRWDGFFVGVNAGGAFGSSPANLKARYDGETTFYSRDNIDAINSSGLVGGIGAGYNFSSGPVVFGIEADLNYLGAKGRDGDEYIFKDFQNEVSTEYRSLATVRAKAGVANGNILAYATGGLSVGTFQDYIGGTVAASGESRDFGGGMQTKAGYVIGAGVEYAVTEKLSLKAEYMFADLGRSSLDVNKAFGESWFGGDSVATVNADHKLNIIRVGLNYKF